MVDSTAGWVPGTPGEVIQKSGARAALYGSALWGHPIVRLRGPHPAYFGALS